MKDQLTRFNLQLNVCFVCTSQARAFILSSVFVISLISLALDLTVSHLHK